MKGKFSRALLGQLRVEVFVSRDAVTGWVLAWKADGPFSPVQLRRAAERFETWRKGMTRGTPRCKHVNARGVRLICKPVLGSLYKAGSIYLLCGEVHPDANEGTVRLEADAGRNDETSRAMLDQADSVREAP